MLSHLLKESAIMWTTMALATLSAGADLGVERLRCEYLVNPLGVESSAPRLSWELRSDQRGQRQTAYRILAASSAEALAREEGDLWDTGKAPSDETVHIEYKGKPLKSGVRCYWKVRVWDKDDRPSSWSEPAQWAMGLLEETDWKAKWIEAPAQGTPPGSGEPGQRQPAAYLRKGFTLEGGIRRATLYASALGVYELYLNGKRVGDQLLAPEWTDYHQRVQYQTYDVTELLQSGENAIGGILGDGWYAGRIGLANIVPGGTLWAIYGFNPKLLVQFEIEGADGERIRLVSDESWKASREGAVRENDILDGETYDARREMPGWNVPGFDESAWYSVSVSEVHAKLVSQPNEPIRVIEELKPAALTEPSPGVYIYDLGQNMAGWARMTAQAAPGAVMRLRHGEVLNPDGALYTANLRGAKQEDTYIFATGAPETFEPRFTYHGFRYVEVTGLPAKPAQDALVGRVFNSSAPEVGHFECSDSMLTKLARNILWTQRANLMSSPTDCPQRDERLGWMGDIQVFAPTAIFNMDLGAFFTKWLVDVRDAQAQDGRYPDFAPHPFGPNERFSGVPAWGDAGVIVPWRAYENYGDTRLLARHFDSAMRWIEFIRAKNPDLIWREGRHNNYNDWLNGDTLKLEGYPTEGGAVPPDVFATAFFAYSTELVSRMAGVLKREEERVKYADLAANIRQVFVKEFVSEDGHIQGDTQAGYALALGFGLLPVELRPRAAAHMAAAVERYGGRLSTGIQSTIRLMRELTANGYTDLAYKLALSHERPSWGYPIDLGATTIWERWDGYVEGRGFQDPGMNSFNHWALGAVGEWLVYDVVGLRPWNPEAPGAVPAYKRFMLEPHPGPGLTWARACYHSIRGPIEIGWRAQEGEFELEVSVPPNTECDLRLPASDPENVTESGQPIGKAAGISVGAFKDGRSSLRLTAGRYIFASDLGR